MDYVDCENVRIFYTKIRYGPTCNNINNTYTVGTYSPGKLSVV